MKLPPLPGCTIARNESSDESGVWTKQRVEYWNEDNLRDYGLACALAMREECAKKCEGAQVNRPDDPPANYFDGGLQFCAEKIRSIEVER